MRVLLVVCLAFLCFDSAFAAVTVSSAIAQANQKELVNTLLTMAAQSKWQAVDFLRANLASSAGRRIAVFIAHVVWLAGAMLRTLSNYAIVNLLSGFLVLVAVYVLLRVAIAEYKDLQSQSEFQDNSTISLKLLLRIFAYGTLTLQPTVALLTGSHALDNANAAGYFLLFVSYAFSFLDINDFGQKSVRSIVSAHLMFVGAVLLVVSSYLDHAKFVVVGDLLGPTKLNRGVITLAGHLFLVIGSTVYFVDQ
eukprot:c6816_g1_i1.p1 GENE.c6816_g1_i1~~c6816_g1_i1.p1  ORF type:complete len:251 (+),score=79.40 c6816_g1_i1:52-804(+)